MVARRALCSVIHNKYLAVLPSELDRFVQEYHAPAYGAEVHRLMAFGVEEPDEDEQQRGSDAAKSSNK